MDCVHRLERPTFSLRFGRSEDIDTDGLFRVPTLVVLTECVLCIAPKALLARVHLGVVLEKAFQGTVVSRSGRHDPCVGRCVVFAMVLGEFIAFCDANSVCFRIYSYNKRVLTHVPYIFHAPLTKIISNLELHFVKKSYRCVCVDKQAREQFLSVIFRDGSEPYFLRFPCSFFAVVFGVNVFFPLSNFFSRKRRKSLHYAFCLLCAGQWSSR